MRINFHDIARLQETRINEGNIWIYVADFNVKHKGTDLKNTDRIDVEIADTKYILSQGGVAVFLAHKGRFKDRDTEDLDFVVPHLSDKLGVGVAYFPENNTPTAVQFVQGLRPGTAAIMGNTRKHEGEERNDPHLASQFARLGQYAAIGGFGKAHRAHASNVGIQEFIPSYATESQLKEMVLLAPWAGKNLSTYSVAVLGGVKKEKITTGLVGFAQIYDAIIPGGIVLNTILKVKGYDIGASLIEDSGKTFEREVKEVLVGQYGAKVHIPGKVIVARHKNGQYQDAHTIEVANGVAEGYMIVDYLLPSSATDSLDRMVEENGRLILAGTPGIYVAGFKSATEAVLTRMERNSANCVMLGGDTVSEVPYDGPRSTGGGSALHFVANGTTPVLEALKANKRKFQSYAVS
jgi:phosphoglycerate kinase